MTRSQNIQQVGAGVIHFATRRGARTMCVMMIDTALPLISDEVRKWFRAVPIGERSRRYLVVLTPDANHDWDGTRYRAISTAGALGRGFDSYDEAYDFYEGRAKVACGHERVAKRGVNLGRDEEGNEDPIIRADRARVRPRPEGPR